MDEHLKITSEEPLILTSDGDFEDIIEICDNNTIAPRGLYIGITEGSRHDDSLCCLSLSEEKAQCMVNYINEWLINDQS